MVDFSEGVDLSINLLGLSVIEKVEGSRHDLALYRHPRLGNILVINGEVQHVEAWQALYHEPLVHVPAAFVQKVETVLILGGGSLFAAREVLRYPTVKRCTLVDHDFSVVSLMEAHYSHATLVLNDPRFNLVISDGITYLDKLKDLYDLIINDWIDLETYQCPAPGGLFKALADRLTSDGVCADVMYRNLFEQEYIERTKKALEQAGNTAYSLVAVPEYPGALHVLAVWGGSFVEQNLRQPRNSFQLGLEDGGKNLGLNYYDPRFLSFSLYLPPYLRTRLKQ